MTRKKRTSLPEVTTNEAGCCIQRAVVGWQYLLSYLKYTNPSLALRHWPHNEKLKINNELEVRKPGRPKGRGKKIIMEGYPEGLGEGWGGYG